MSKNFGGSIVANGSAKKSHETRELIMKRSRVRMRGEWLVVGGGGGGDWLRKCSIQNYTGHARWFIFACVQCFFYILTLRCGRGALKKPYGKRLVRCQKKNVLKLFVFWQICSRDLCIAELPGFPEAENLASTRSTASTVLRLTSRHGYIL